MQIDNAFRDKVIDIAHESRKYDIACVLVPDAMTDKMYRGVIKSLEHDWHCDYNTTRAPLRMRETRYSEGTAAPVYKHVPDAAIIPLGIKAGDAPFLDAGGNVDKNYLDFLFLQYKCIIITCRASATPAADKFFED